MNFRASVGHPPFISVKRAQPVTLAGQEIGFSIGSSGTTYVPTHYVAPFASVSGATDDYTDLGQPAFNNSANTGTPTTLGTAMRWATAGNKVRCSPGVYVGNLTGSRNTPSFRPTGVGTALNPIVFFAQHPAAYNWGSTSLYSEIRRIGSVLDGTLCPAMGTTSGKDYIIFDGFYANEAITQSSPNRGIFYLGGGVTGVQYRRCAFTRGGDYTGTSGHNPNAIYLETTIDAVVSDCYFSGRVSVYPSNIRQTGNIEVYNSSNYLLQYNTHDGNYSGQYIKEDDLGGSYRTSGRMIYNRFLNCLNSLLQQKGLNNEIAYNLVYLSSETNGTALQFVGVGGLDLGGGKDYNVHHNTFVIGGGVIGWLLFTQDIITSDFNNNIIYAVSGATGATIDIGSGTTGWTWANWTLNNNCYYSVNGPIRFRPSAGAALVTGLPAWQAAISQEGSSINSDPLFVDATTHDYRLQGGSPASGKGCYVTGTEEIGLRANPTY